MGTVKMQYHEDKFGCMTERSTKIIWESLCMKQSIIQILSKPLREHNQVKIKVVNVGKHSEDALMKLGCPFCAAFLQEWQWKKKKRGLGIVGLIRRSAQMKADQLLSKLDY